MRTVAAIQASAVKRRMNKSGAVYLLFLLNPFISLIIGLLNWRDGYARNILWLYSIFLGYTFVISSNDFDADRYRDLLIELNSSQIALADVTALIYSTQFADVVQPLVTFFVSRFTSNEQWLFAIFGGIFGFFYSRNIFLLIALLRGELNRHAVLFLLLFAFILPLWQINGFRMWTAAHVFVYFMLRYFSNSKKINLLLTGLAILIHFSFVIPFLSALIFYVLEFKHNACFVLFLLSFIIQANSITFDHPQDLPIVIEQKLASYSNQEYLGNLQVAIERKNWYIRYRPQILTYSLWCAMLYLFFVCRKYWSNSVQRKRVMSFALLLSAMANFLVGLGIGSLDRYTIIANLFIIIMVIIFSADSRVRATLRPIMPPVVVVVLFYIIVEMRIGFDTVSVDTIISNPLFAVFSTTKVPLIELVK